MLREAGLFGRLAADAVDLARSLKKQGEEAPRPSTREAVKAALTQDGYHVLLLSRVREAARRLHVPVVNHALRMVTTAVYGIEIGNEVQLGSGTNFVHTLGIILGGDSKIGARVRFMGNNTVGTAKDNGYPVIEDDVVVGCGARVLGPIRVGRGAVIGANAVVIHDVPPGAVVSGIPAKVHAGHAPLGRGAEPGPSEP